VGNSGGSSSAVPAAGLAAGPAAVAAALSKALASALSLTLGRPAGGKEALAWRRRAHVLDASGSGLLGSALRHQSVGQLTGLLLAEPSRGPESSSSSSIVGGAALFQAGHYDALVPAAGVGGGLVALAALPSDGFDAAIVALGRLDGEDSSSSSRSSSSSSGSSSGSGGEFSALASPGALDELARAVVPGGVVLVAFAGPSSHGAWAHAWRALVHAGIWEELGPPAPLPGGGNAVAYRVLKSFELPRR
jgi:hypothetical protein